MPDTLRVASFIDKGGTGKTTATAHLGVALALEGEQVLLLDLAGKQGDLAKQFGRWEAIRTDIDNDDAWPNIATVFKDQWSAIAEKLGDDAVEDLIYRTGERVDIIPAHPGLDTLDSQLGDIDDASDRYSRLQQFLDEYVEPLDYDAILIDLPGLTNNVSYNGLWAAGHVVAPVEMGPYESDQAAQLNEDLQQMVKTFEVDVDLTMILPNKVDMRTKLSDQYLDEYEDEYPSAIAPEPIPLSQDIRNAAEQGCTVFRLANPSQTATQARKAYRANAKALIERIRDQQ